MLFVNILIVYLILVPLAVLIHEIGHALAVIFFTKRSDANVFLGAPVTNNCLHFKIGRIHFYLRWANFGFCSSIDQDGKASTEIISEGKRIAIYSGGPLVSFLAALIAFATSPLLSGELNSLMRAFTVLNLFTFLSTSLPYIYPKWRKGLGGTPTDGLRVKRVWQKLREERKQRRKAV
ncbi:hypothetical protein FZC78_11095 [Rossellomorea vietnamensis]|uniref:Peptidase M50 domain-containing protein n=1 Tax=Rossellomorea vietnamensis TaxID=218284 RepID=A0A5D4NT72_9BACI|nr:site-2 protease family protein [Rossellomorea vietnamensis]TYS17150.1 hypothetical protein FZC78_11095 [Rossellomorea vietnamensis]